MLNKVLKIKNSQNSLYLIQKKLKLIILKILKNKNKSNNRQFNNKLKLNFNNQKYNRINKLFKNQKVYLNLIKNMV